VKHFSNQSGGLFKDLLCIRRCFLCLNPVSAHTVCLAWYIVKERSLLREAGCVFYAILGSGQDPFGSFFVTCVTF
ncbi:hypothetical protein, partial [Pseudidiomarina marina]|uniref:hypothetical protein n=1 Tax=Pseudidiomarina marina TaxID=502366 RepID=UPI001A7E0663